ncbi:hypothetical protein PSI23_11175 [Xenorhabdus sp. XENO-10]|uniref:Uncharacterized protein n=1 Tax=Xenorhabdus yunnanensis TaxID=3025878 RepID=A0ABT5LJ86_9GAMM|nr:hypothetical protein [Xenorhabdus yunnanensis]MDC9589845.1 hypothetical protein [Xenorhabdus yunnanensis]
MTSEELRIFGDKPLHLMLGPDDFPFSLFDEEQHDPLSVISQLAEKPWDETSKFWSDERTFPDSERSSQVIHDRLRSELQTMLATDVTLARDIAYFGDNKISLICKAYSLSDNDVLLKLKEDDFALLVKTFRKDMEKDVNGMLRARAKLMVDAQLDAIHDLVMNKDTRDSDRVRAFTAMAQIADAIPRNEKGDMINPGLAANIVFNFGDQSPFSPKLKAVSEQGVVIDMEAD